MLRAVMGFDHIAKNVVDTWIATSGYLITKYSSSPKGLIIDSNGALSTPTGVSTGYVTQANIDFSPYMVPTTPTLLVVSFKLTVVSGTPSSVAFYLGSVNTGSDASFQCPWSSLPAAASVVGAVTAIDAEIDLTTGNVNVYANGVLATTIALSASPLAAIKTGKLCLFVNFTSASGASNIISLREVYLLDNLAGDAFTARTSGKSVQPITFDAATGAGWTATNGADVLTTLNVAPETSGAALVTAPADHTPLQLSMASALPAGHVVEAIAVTLSAKLDVAGTLCKGSMVDGSAASTPTATKNALTTTLVYGIPAAPLFPRHPSGVRWNATNINSAAFVITPDQAS